ncbi:MAG: type II CAAX prenyl endopeptidase Rce1 family protein [Oscillospiraceae bacterium]
MLVLTSLLFAAAHINFAVPFSLQWIGILYAFINGVAYGFVFLRSESVIYPMIMHSASNLISVGGCYLYMVLFNAA